MTKFSKFFYISLQQWELIVLNKLKWNISSVTPLDFLEHLLVRLPINKQHTDVSQIKKHAQAFISLAARGKFKIEFIFVLSNSAITLLHIKGERNKTINENEVINPF